MDRCGQQADYTYGIHSIHAKHVLPNLLKRAVLQHRNRFNERRRRDLGQTSGLAPGHWGAQYSPTGELLIGGCDVGSLATRYGTPLFIVDRTKLVQDYLAFINSFNSLYPNIEIGCSYKTNPLPCVLQTLHECGALAEVISHFELWLALRLGVDPSRILFNGPGKDAESVGLAVSKGVKLINIDSIDEAEMVASAARAAGRIQDVGARVITSVGWSSQFGLSIASGAAYEAFRRLKQSVHCRPVGIHIHLGTGIREVGTYLKAVREVMDFARALQSSLGIRISYFDLGGGFGVPTVRAYGPWDQRLMAAGLPPDPIDPAAAPVPADYAREIVPLVREYYPQGEDFHPVLAFEPGRAIMSSAQSLVLKVLVIKDGKYDSPTVILNGGKNVAMPAGWEQHEMLPVSIAGRALQRYNFFGPLCHPGDWLFVEKFFPALKVGDFVAIMDSGAYFVPNQMNFSHPRAAAVMVGDGNDALARRAETFDDVIAKDLLA